MKRLLFASFCGAGLATSSFASVLMNETFSYADGPLTTVSGGVWISHSGTALQQDVASGVLNVTQSESEDTHANFAAQGAGSTIWTGIDLNMTAAPSATGTYFMHYSDGGTSNFKAKVFATTAGAATGFYRLGISDVANTGYNTVTTDLALGTTYRVLFSSDVDTNDSSLEVVGVGTALHADTATATVLSAINFRQASGMGTMTVDNLLIGTTRDDVLPVPEPVSVLGLATGLVALARRRKK